MAVNIQTPAGLVCVDIDYYDDSNDNIRPLQLDVIKARIARSQTGANNRKVMINARVRVGFHYQLTMGDGVQDVLKSVVNSTSGMTLTDDPTIIETQDGRKYQLQEDYENTVDGQAVSDVLLTCDSQTGQTIAVQAGETKIVELNPAQLLWHMLDDETMMSTAKLSIDKLTNQLRTDIETAAGELAVSGIDAQPIPDN